MSINMLVSLFIFCTSASVGAQNWHNFNGFQYSIEITPVNSYAEAEMGCSALQANVANIKTIELNNFLRRLFIREDSESIYGVYNGAKGIRNTSKFRWNDGSNVSVPANVWAIGQPDNFRGQERCILIFVKTTEKYLRYKWFAMNCTTHSAGYVCQKVIPHLTKPNPTIVIPFTKSKNIITLPSTKPIAKTTLLFTKQITTTILPFTEAIINTTLPFNEPKGTKISIDHTTRAQPKVNTVTVASAIAGCAVLVIICIAIVVVTACKKRRIEPSAGKADKTENITMKTLTNPSIYVNTCEQPSRPQQPDDTSPYYVNHKQYGIHQNVEMPYYQPTYVNTPLNPITSRSLSDDENPYCVTTE